MASPGSWFSYLFLADCRLFPSDLTGYDGWLAWNIVVSTKFLFEIFDLRGGIPAIRAFRIIPLMGGEEGGRGEGHAPPMLHMTRIIRYAELTGVNYPIMKQELC